MRVLARRVLTAALASVTVAALLTMAPAPAGATPSFYDPPTPLPSGDNGDIIKHEPTDFFVAPLVKAPAIAQRIMYLSRDTHDQPVAVTGVVLTPTMPWSGPGPRPIIGYAPGTQGVGDDCAPSKAMANGTEYEGPFVSGLLERGFGVVVTDYEGLGTPGMHTYVNRAAEGHAVLDAIRAAQRLPGSGLPTNGPVGISGYSQGGGASAAAAELQPGYAPELDVKGAYAGAVPADLAVVARNLDGHYAVGFIGYALAGMDYAYPELHVTNLLNARGRQVYEQVKTECTPQAIFAHAFTQTKDLTADGRPLAAYLDQEPYRSRVEEQRIGVRRPAVPMLVAHSGLDDIVPYEQDRTMARAWCGKGARVQFNTLAVPTHAAAMLEAYPQAVAWLGDRFAGRPAPDNCGAF